MNKEQFEEFLKRTGLNHRDHDNCYHLILKDIREGEYWKAREILIIGISCKDDIYIFSL